MRNNLIGGCFLSTNQKRDVCVFLAVVWDLYENVWFHNRAKAQLWNENFLEERSVQWKRILAYGFNKMLKNNHVL